MLWGTCDPGRVGSPYAPWAEALGGRADPRDYDAVAAALDGGPVVVLDDLQWASAETIELLGARRALRSRTADRRPAPRQ